jgi:WD40 repeat protein
MAVGTLDRRGDVYGLGATLWEVLALRPLFDATDETPTPVLMERILYQEPGRLRPLNPDVPRDLEAVCLKCLQKEPAKRYASAAELAADLRRWLAGESVTARLPGPAERLGKWARRRPAVAALAAAVASVTVLAFVLVTSAWAQALQKADDEARARRDESEARVAAEQAQGNEHEARKQAEEAARKEAVQKKNAERAADETRAQYVRLLVDNGSRRALEGDPLGALPWFAAALRDDPRRGDVSKVHRLRVASFTRYGPQAVRTIILEDAARYAAFSPDGKRLVSVASSRAASARGQSGLSVFFEDTVRYYAAPGEQFRVWDVGEGRPVGPPLTPWGNRGDACCAAFSPDGRRLLTVVYRLLHGNDSVLQLWDARTGKALTAAVAFRGFAESASFNKGGDRILTLARPDPLGDTCEARLWNCKTLRERAALDHKGGVRHATFNADGDRVATAGLDGVGVIWRAATGERECELEHGAPLEWVGFSPDGKSAVTADKRGTVKFWDVETGTPTGQSLSHGGRIAQVSFSSDGKRLVTASADGTAQVWQTDGTRFGFPLPHPAAVHQASFSRDGRYVLTVCADHVVRLWAVGATAAGPAALIRHNGPVAHAAFSPDGKHFLTASKDRTVRVWPTAPRGPETHPGGAAQKVLSVAPDGKRALIADLERTWYGSGTSRRGRKRCRSR